ncbi:MAG: 50S ribosomal protein L10 [Candidatus Pacebacteria bacterium]|nr:50S ribosomal protein L10 [Candidatus Paceibacterota bacterium]
MAVTKQKKEAIEAKLDSAFSDASTIVFVRQKAMQMSDAQVMRAKLKEEGVSYYIAKKTLIKRALAGRKYAGEQPSFEGELAVAWSDDLIAPAREINAFVKSTKEKVQIVGGVFDGTYMSAVEMREIANIPSRQTLYAQFVMLINSPIQQFVMALDQIAQKKEA